MKIGLCAVLFGLLVMAFSGLAGASGFVIPNYIVYYANISISNSQSHTIVNGLQIMVTFNALAYQNYETVIAVGAVIGAVLHYRRRINKTLDDLKGNNNVRNNIDTGNTSEIRVLQSLLLLKSSHLAIRTLYRNNRETDRSRIHDIS